MCGLCHVQRTVQALTECGTISAAPEEKRAAKEFTTRWGEDSKKKVMSPAHATQPGPWRLNFRNEYSIKAKKIDFRAFIVLTVQ